MYVIKNLFINTFHLSITKEIYRNLPRKPHCSVNPGIKHRKRLLDNQDDGTIDLSNYDYDLESDFANIGNSYKDHVDEINKERHRICKHIIKQKYFKEKTPNFLTWNDKEQIRYLHNTNPEEWTIEKLSEGFPALPHVIAKIIKPRRWEKNSEKKIQNHDKSVQKNWELLKENKLTNLSINLIEHLKKFTDRNLNVTFTVRHNLYQNRQNAKNIVGSEFSEIIARYEQLKKKGEETFGENMKFSRSVKNQHTKNDTYLLSGKGNKYQKHTTLQELQNSIVKKSISGTVTQDEEALLAETKKEIEKPKHNETVSEKSSNITDTSSTKLVTVLKKKANNYLLEYPDKIIIPKDKQKLGCTYKLNDCYYDDDGLFLYRVPGMYK